MFWSILQLCNDMCGGWVDVWRSDTLAVKQLSEPKKHHQDGLMSSTKLFCGSCFVIGSVLTYNFCGNVPLLHTSTQHPGMSLHVISFTRSSPTLVLQVASAGWEGLGTRLSYTSSSCNTQWSKFALQLLRRTTYMHTPTYMYMHTHTVIRIPIAAVGCNHKFRSTSTYTLLQYVCGMQCVVL